MVRCRQHCNQFSPFFKRRHRLHPLLVRQVKDRKTPLIYWIYAYLQHKSSNSRICQRVTLTVSSPYVIYIAINVMSHCPASMLQLFCRKTRKTIRSSYEAKLMAEWVIIQKLGKECLANMVLETATTVAVFCWKFATHNHQQYIPAERQLGGTFSLGTGFSWTTQRMYLGDILTPRAMLSPECHSDHQLVCCKFGFHR